MILDEPFLRKLEQLSLVARHLRAGAAPGERRSTKRGTSVEFADYRDYVRGDDLRRVDWNIYARLQRPFVKLFEEQEDLAVHLLLDGSGSMDWMAQEQGGAGAEQRGQGGSRGAGGPDDRETGEWKDQETGRPGHDHGDQGKWMYARRLAAALGYVALTSGDRLQVALLQASSPPLSFGPVRGRGHVLRLFAWLERLEAQGTTDLNAALRAYALAAGRPGLAVLISDLFSPPGYLEGITRLAARGHEVAVVHLLAPDEVEPPLAGDLRLLDVETGQPQEVTVDAQVRALYRRRLAAWRDDIQAACRTRDVHYVPVDTDTPLDRLVLYNLRRTGVVG
jgi:uncharacterized protein (DUF58 family)